MAIILQQEQKQQNDNNNRNRNNNNNNSSNNNSYNNNKTETKATKQSTNLDHRQQAWIYFYITYRWLSARLQLLQCDSNNVPALLLQGVAMMHFHLTCICIVDIESTHLI